MIPAPHHPAPTFQEFLAHPDIDERAEFLYGKVLEPLPEPFRHLCVSRDLERILGEAVGRDRALRKFPLLFEDHYLRPDVVVLRHDFQTYPLHGAFDLQEIRWIVEVCLSTHDRDYGPKDTAYAQAGIPEYWIVDLDRDRIERRTEPTPMGYAKHEVSFRGSSLLGIEVERILGEPSRGEGEASV